MARNIKVRLYTAATKRDEYGEITGEPQLWRDVWCTRTESGGRANTYAGRIVRENETVLTTHWLPGIEEAIVAEWDGHRRPIAGVICEGFRKTAHIKVTDNASDYEAGY